MNCAKIPIGLVALALLVGACGDTNTGTAPGGSGPEPVIELGDPLPDLTADELAAFERGKLIFEKRFTPSQGLGPLYNATSCASCHSNPVTGGTSDLYRNFYLARAISPLFSVNLPGLPSPVVPAFGFGAHPFAVFTLERGRHVIPSEAFGAPVTSAQRNGIPIFGVGLFEFVSDATILANADPDDSDSDGISGRVNNDRAGLGRFGLKAQSNNIELFTRAPLQNQMGVTSNPFLGSAGTVRLGHTSLVQASSSPNDPTRDRDGVPDPEISHEDLGDLIAFSRFLAPPQARGFDGAATRGQDLFRQIGCAKCHIPSLESSRGPVRAFTDLLIHDMGPELADRISFGTPQASSLNPSDTGHEFRTQPLWGISHFAPYLHDGRARTLDEAIRMHGGEAESIRLEYITMTQSQRDDLLAFLRHL